MKWEGTWTHDGGSGSGAGLAGNHLWTVINTVVETVYVIVYPTNTETLYFTQILEAFMWNWPSVALLALQYSD